METCIHVANTITAVLVLLCLLGFFFAPQIVRYILVPGFSLNDPALQLLTVKLLRIQLPSVVIFGLSGLIMGILNANQHFLLPGLAPQCISLVSYSVSFFFQSHWGSKVWRSAHCADRFCTFSYNYLKFSDSGRDNFIFPLDGKIQKYGMSSG